MKSLKEAEANTAHIITIGNEKGGCGKSTLTMHLAIYLLQRGQRVGVVDVDSRQRSSSHHIAHRVAFCRQTGSQLSIPSLYTIQREVDKNDNIDFYRENARFAQALSTLESKCDFILIDTPAYDTHLMRMAHSICDTLLTPINESFVDINVIADVHPSNHAVIEPSHYAQIVQQARKHRREVDGGEIDWVVAINRRATTETRNSKALKSCLNSISKEFGFRSCVGLTERGVYREHFPDGLTALDAGHISGSRHALKQAQHSARFELEALFEQLRLPINTRREEQKNAIDMWKTSSNTTTPNPAAQLFGI